MDQMVDENQEEEGEEELDLTDEEDQDEGEDDDGGDSNGELHLTATSGGGCAAGEPSIGMEFPTDEAAREFYCAYAARAGFTVRMNKSRRSRKDDSLIMRRFVCTREGFHSKNIPAAAAADGGKRKRKRATSREGCMAMLEVAKKDSPSRWVVTKLVAHHTHPVSLPVQTSPAPAGASNRVARANPFGEGGEAQGVLEYLMRMQAESPGFFYAMQVDSSNCVTNVFWADARARTAYKSFGDAVNFDTTYKKTKYMAPFAAFRGTNHHLQGVNFGCCLLMDETKGSYMWLFDTWLVAMGGRHPDLLVTDWDKAMEGAIAKLMPNTLHRFCQRHILSRCKQKLSDVYTKHAGLQADLKECIGASETTEEFEARWVCVLDHYNLQENGWLQALYDSRQKWACVYQKELFFPELLKSQRSDSLNKFFKAHFSAKTPLLVFITRFNQAMALRTEKEAQADFATVFLKGALKTPSLIEKQAARVYTKAVFDVFQEEFIESLGYHADKIEDGTVLKYNVAKEEENGRSYNVSFNQSDKKVKCSCGKFEYSGILCRHVLRIFFMVGVRNLPEEYILKRWTMDAVGSAALHERILEPGVSFPECLVSWYNDLCVDAIKYGMGGAATPDVYKVAKVALQKAFTDVVAAKSMQRCEQHNYARQQNMLQHKMPLPKVLPKKASTRVAHHDGVGRSKRSTKDDPVDGLPGNSSG